MTRIPISERYFEQGAWRGGYQSSARNRFVALALDEPKQYLLQKIDAVGATANTIYLLFSMQQFHLFFFIASKENVAWMSQRTFFVRKGP